MLRHGIIFGSPSKVYGVSDNVVASLVLEYTDEGVNGGTWMTGIT